MKSIFRATAILSGSSFVTILLSLVSAKVMALVLQPVGYGYYGLVQSFVAVATLIVGMGMATGLVRYGAGPVERGEQAAVVSLRRGAWLLFWGLGSLALVLLGLFRGTLSHWALGSADHGTTILLTGTAILFTVAGNVQMGMLNAHHRVGGLAKNAVVNSVGGALVSILAVLVWRTRGIIPAIIAAAAVSWVVSRYYLHREVGPIRGQAAFRDSLQSAWLLLRFGVPFAASMFVGTGVQLALPMVVVHLLSTESVGYYKAAAAISVGYLGFLVTAMGQDYYPRVSAARDRPAALVELINAQHRLVMLVAVPMILGSLALVPYLVPLVYSRKFNPAVEILEWQLIGDLFKFSSWTMSFALLARCGSSVYFLTESVGGVAALATTWLAVRWFGLTGLGISFVATYIIYYSVVWVIIRRQIPLSLTAWNKRMMLAGVAAALIVRILPSTRFAGFRTPVALTLAMAFGIPSLFIIWREFMASKEAEALAPPNGRSGRAAVTTAV
jgi:PST family polysaccharide transporter